MHETESVLVICELAERMQHTVASHGGLGYKGVAEAKDGHLCSMSISERNSEQTVWAQFVLNLNAYRSVAALAVSAAVMRPNIRSKNDKSKGRADFNDEQDTPTSALRRGVETTVWNTLCDQHARAAARIDTNSSRQVSGEIEDV